MARILIVANINVDRLWRLSQPLRPGARIAHEGIAARMGGGGWYTGAELLARGHRVRIMTRLADDAAGRRCRAALEARGFDTSLVAMSEEVTRPNDILVDPAGERTILFPAAARRRPVEAIPADDSDLVYINVQRMLPAASEALLGRCPVVAQFPLAEGERRPAEVLIASRSDLGMEDRAALLAAARDRAGANLHALVLTDGPSPVRVIEAGGERVCPVPPCARVAATVGAGDTFAAGFIDGLLAGGSPAEAAAAGNAAAGRFLATPRAGEDLSF